jgi:predicted small secreted protein
MARPSGAVVAMLLAAAALLQGCANAFEGMGSRNYDASVTALDRAARTTLASLGASVDDDRRFASERERWIYARVAHRTISLRLVPVTANTTQLTVVANAREEPGDRATAPEILAGTEQALQAQRAAKTARRRGGG